MSTIPESPFDGDRNWLDVRASVARRLRNKFRPLNIEDVLEDVLSEVMVDLLGYWSQLASSHKENQLSFAFAVKRGTWMGTHKVTRVFAHHNTEVAFAATSFVKDAVTPDNGWNWGDDRPEDLGLWNEVFIDPSPGPEDIACDDDDLSRARKMLLGMSNDDLQEYFAELTGESARVEAERTGTPRATVQRRRKARRLQLIDRAAKYGLQAVAE